MGYAEQARISEQHRAAQARLQAIVAADTARVFPLLDVNNIDRSFGQYFEGMKTVVNARRTVSASLGASYYSAMRSDAGVTGRFTPALSAIVDEDQLFTSLLVTGPVSMKKNLTAGVDPATARQAALTSTIKTAQRHVINGSRGTILNAVRRDDGSVGWARLTDGQPCAFCALLASRGPAYKSEGTSKFRAHDGCGCTAVPVFDPAAPWPGRAQEFRDQYDANISGKFSGGDGNNDAVRAWRKFYDGKLVTPNVVEDVAETLANAVESSLDWRGAWAAAKERIPESGFGRVGGRPLTASELAQYQEAVATERYLDDFVDRFNGTKSLVEQNALKKELADRLGIDTSGSLLWQSALRRAKTEAGDVRRNFDNVRKGKLDRTASGLPGDVANEHLDAILQAGNAVGTELERRIAVRLADLAGDTTAVAQTAAAREAVEKKLADALEKAKAHKATLRLQAIERVDKGISTMSGTYDEKVERVLNYLLFKDKTNKANIAKIKALSKEQGDLLELERKLAGGIQPGTPQYAQLVREETIKILEEVRPMGGAGPRYVRAGKPIGKGELVEAMDKAHAAYPASWMERLRREIPDVDLGSSKRGYNTSQGRVIRLSKSKTKIVGDKGYDAVAIHELGHSMEHIIDGLPEMQWAYHTRRGMVRNADGTFSPGRVEHMGSGYGRDERTIPDQWRERYTGKVYDSTGDNWEVFTTGIESLMSGSRYLANDALGYDAEFRDWLLGVLSVL